MVEALRLVEVLVNVLRSKRPPSWTSSGRALLAIEERFRTRVRTARVVGPSARAELADALREYSMAAMPFDLTLALRLADLADALWTEGRTSS